MSEPPPALELRDVTKCRRVPDGNGGCRELQALSHVSLSIPDGCLHSLLGPSGSGKSTLLRLLNRLDDPDEGAVLLRGQDVRHFGVTALRRRVGMVQQRAALFDGTVLDNLVYGPRLWRVPERECQERARRCLDLVGLSEELLPRPSDQLSGGQQHRVALARALANEPEVLLLDEPTASLDPSAVAGILRLVASLNEKLGLTVVLVTHGMEQVRALGGRVAVLVDGRIVETGSTAALLECPSSDVTRRFLNGTLAEREEP